ncbi:hypothetical protein [Ornithinibacillus scapharcae]|uniref:hypothetical protein n=1 Tax=Ornithinibacillus scapharcae TaxID=1147159 RepID=UPI000225B40F|nr:hypothetical protein [Ornithinibacillus scapharcae]
MKKLIFIGVSLVIALLIFLNWNNIVFREIHKHTDKETVYVYKQNRFTKNYLLETYTPEHYIKKELITSRGVSKK